MLTVRYVMLAMLCCKRAVVCAMLTMLCTILQEKNVSFDSLEGKVGRVYMPKQDLGSMALNKMKVGHLMQMCIA